MFVELGNVFYRSQYQLISSIHTLLNFILVDGIHISLLSIAISTLISYSTYQLIIKLLGMTIDIRHIPLQILRSSILNISNQPSIPTSRNPKSSHNQSLLRSLL